MTPQQVKALVDQEIARDPQRAQPLELDSYCRPALPALTTFKDSWHENRDITLWSILKDDLRAALGNGYEVVYSEEEGLFGLAVGVKDQEKAVLVGFYGSFLETMEAM